jgi:hypothetical protein
VPCALVQQSPGGALKAYQATGNAITATLSWSDITPRIAPVVSWEFWSNSNDECGVKCARQQAFMRDIKAPVMAMMQARVMTFSPHYITLQCGSAASTEYCMKQCINKGRYCQMDPDGTLDVRLMRAPSCTACAHVSFADACFHHIPFSVRRAATAGAMWCWRTCGRCACSAR